MTKISKNIKKFRTQKKLTQETVANQLFVTRQTVSSWESGRTEPDIETLCRLAGLFGIEIEELIYGRLKMTDEEKDKKAKQRLIVIFSALASVLTAVGLVLIFVTCWNRMPPVLQTVFGFVPMLAGQTAAVVTYIRFRKSVAWREGAAVLWGAGVVATIALIDSIHLISADFTDCLLIDILLVLPVIYILDAVTPLLFCYGGLIYFAIDSYNSSRTLNVFVIVPILFIVCFSYVFINRKRVDDPRQIFAKWISTVSFAVLAVILIIATGFADVGLFMLITAFFACMYFSSFGGERISSVAVVGITGTVAMVTASVFLYQSVSLPYYLYEYYSIAEIIGIRVASCLGVAALAVTGIIRRKKFKNDVSANILFLSTIIFVIIQALFCVIPYGSDGDFLYIPMVIGSFAFAVSMTVYGGLNNKLFSVNLGLVSIAVMLGYIIMFIDMLATGIMLVAFGGVIFVVNYFIARKIKRQKEGADDA